jgi:hypothetical protein
LLFPQVLLSLPLLCLFLLFLLLLAFFFFLLLERLEGLARRFNLEVVFNYTLFSAADGSFNSLEVNMKLF